MRRASTPMILALALLAVPGCGQAATTFAASAAGALGASRAATDIVVRFKPRATRQATLQALGLKTVGRVPGIDALVVKAADPKAALAALKADPGVAYAATNQKRRWLAPEPAVPAIKFEADGGDDLLETLWGMKRIGAIETWPQHQGTRDVKVAVVDTGVDYNHPDLVGRVVKGRDVVNKDDDPMDDQSHGTHCAGTIAAGLGDGGVVGVAPNVTLLAVKVLNADGWGDDVGVAEGIVYAADQGAHVINLSLGGAEQVQVINDAVAYATAKGSLVVAAMGNEGSGEPSYPGASPGAMAVAALQPGDLIASYSNWGPHCSVLAPGSWVMSTLPNGRWGRKTGTSMATPHVAGLAALLKSARPELDAQGLRKRIEATASDQGYPGWDKFGGWGVVNAAKALAPTR